MALKELLDELAAGCVGDGEIGMAEQVAVKLLAEGCRGLPNDLGRCPVAIWLSRRGVYAPEVGEVSVDGDDTSEFLPVAVARFVKEFDDGAFTALIRRSGPRE